MKGTDNFQPITAHHERLSAVAVCLGMWSCAQRHDSVVSTRTCEPLQLQPCAALQSGCQSIKSDPSYPSADWRNSHRGCPEAYSEASISRTNGLSADFRNALLRTVIFWSPLSPNRPTVRAQSPFSWDVRPLLVYVLCRCNTLSRHLTRHILCACKYA